MRQYKFKINGNEYNVDIKNYEDNTVTLEVNGTPYEVELQEEMAQKQKTPKLVRTQQRPPQEEKKLTRSSGLTTIKAPLPAKVISILVKEGDEVNKDQKLMVVEAMKMENNILAEDGGTVKSIKVNEGDNVQQGEVLVEIE